MKTQINLASLSKVNYLVFEIFGLVLIRSTWQRSFQVPVCRELGGSRPAWQDGRTSGRERLAAAGIKSTALPLDSHDFEIELKD
ncbi:hypothetical protein [Burkholderia plantarii]|uniref:hypothetical protein n=1 Tax=Burkholderia plantarii TaxID=41899 RepID=UPI0018DC9508|nr:hypothetical protein [Burkholderia plantarii]MBI0328638.1 hypothetical protein [Burkholderia plantarii]